MGLAHGLLEGCMIRCFNMLSIISEIFSRCTKGTLLKCCLTGELSPVSISCFTKLVQPNSDSSNANTSLLLHTNSTILVYSASDNSSFGSANIFNKRSCLGLPRSAGALHTRFTTMSQLPLSTLQVSLSTVQVSLSTFVPKTVTLPTTLSCFNLNEYASLLCRGTNILLSGFTVAIKS